MYLKNNTGKGSGHAAVIQFKAGEVTYTVKPGHTVAIDDSLADNHNVRKLLAKGLVVKVEDDKAVEEIVEQEAEKQAKAEERKVEVKMADDGKERQVIMVQCAAETASGERCLNNVSVPIADYDEEKPAFCRHHKNSDPADYERVDGAWVKKHKE